MDPLLPQYQFSNFSKGFFTVLPHDHPPEPLRFKPWNFLCATFSSYGNFDRRFLELGSGWEWGSREVKMWLAYGIWFFNCNFFWSNFMSSKVCVFFNVPNCLPCLKSQDLIETSQFGSIWKIDAYRRRILSFLGGFLCLSFWQGETV